MFYLLFPPEYRKVTAYMGSHSGKIEDKIAPVGQKVDFTENNTHIFQESRLILECRKVYAHDLDRSKYSESLIGNYAQKKFQGVIPHTVYFGEIINCWVKNEKRTM